MARVFIENVTKRFGDVIAVRDFTLEIKDKEFLVLVGPSGCGKSTLLRMVAGLEDIVEGKIYIGERVVNDLAPKDRDIAMVFQNYALYPHMNVYDNIAFGLKMRGYSKSEIDARVREAAKILEIEHLLTRKPAQLSGGQRQRVAMGRAIVRKPAVFLFDEPLSNLDAKLRVQMRLEIKRLHSRIETTVIYVTHDQVEAMTLADRVAVMKDGVLQQVDTPQRVYDNPKNLFVAGFLGNPTMNFVEAKIESQNGRFFAIADGFSIVLPTDFNSALEKCSSRKVILGIRPEHIHVIPRPDLSCAELRGMVEVIEPLGSELIAYVRVGSNLLAVKTRPDVQLARASNISLYAEVRAIKIFDPDTGINLIEKGR